MRFCQCLPLINTDVCFEFHEILSILSASKTPEKNLKFDELPWQQHLRYQEYLNSFTSAMFWCYSDEVWNKPGKNKRLISKHFKDVTFCCQLVAPFCGTKLMTFSEKFVGADEIYMCLHFDDCRSNSVCYRSPWNWPYKAVCHGPNLLKLCPALMAADSNVYAKFQEFFSMLGAPKAPETLKLINSNNSNNNP